MSLPKLGDSLDESSKGARIPYEAEIDRKKRHKAYDYYSYVS